MSDIGKWFKAKSRRHHNNKGYRQIKNGITIKRADRLSEKMKIRRQQKRYKKDI